MLVRDRIPRDDDPDDLLVLTTAHLFLDLADDAPVLVAPPDPLDPPQQAGRPFGKIRRRVPLVHLPHIAVDAAVIKPMAGVDCSPLVAGGQPTGIRDLWAEQPEDDVRVMKHGAKTGLTCGTLTPIQADLMAFDVAARYTSGWMVAGDEQLFATQGDSGAIVVDEERRIVGMAVTVDRAGDDPTIECFCHGIAQILRALEVEML